MDIFNSIKISSSALKAQGTRLNVISSNMANVETTRTPEGGPYRKKDVVFRTSNQSFDKHLAQNLREGVQGVEVAAIQNNPSPLKMIYEPSHPDADADGYVALPNINILEEMTDMMTATKSYEANVTAINAAKRMALKALDIGK